MQDKNNEVSPKTTYLNEYCPSAFLIKNVHLTFQLNEAKTVVKSKLTTRTILYHIMFISFILISILITINILVEKFYFYPKIYSLSNSGSINIYGSFLTIAGTL